MNRRTALRLAAAAASVGMFPAHARAQVSDSSPFLGPRNPLAAPWAAWKAAYLAADGRVVDTLQQGASHSESQGYGLCLAAIFGDDAAFDAIFAWTEANLAIRADALLAWRWLPAEAARVPDRNNASDGDLFYAWGLAIRARRDGDSAKMERARAIAADLADACMVPAPDGSGRLILLPAAQGFERDGGAVINPSYLMPLALREVARATGVAQLSTCAADGLALMTDLTRSGPAAVAAPLPVPDWVEVGPQGLFPPVDRPDRNGYEAMRVPLFLIWSGAGGHAAVAAQARLYRAAAARIDAGSEVWSDTDTGPFVTVFDRKTGDVLETSHHAGYGALAALVDCVTADARGAAIPLYRTVDQAYYPATLHLMALVAQIAVAPECMPI